MAFKHGIYPKTLIDTIAKALYFDEPSDAEAVKLKMLRQQKGIEYVLQTVCGLDKTERLYHEILKSVEQIKEQGLVKGHE